MLTLNEARTVLGLPTISYVDMVPLNPRRKISRTTTCLFILSFAAADVIYRLFLRERARSLYIG
jgi:hypothetical protein